MPAAKENFKKLFTQKEKEMEPAVEEINDLLTHNNALSENVSQAVSHFALVQSDF